MEFYLRNWVELSRDFGKVVPSGTTQGYFCLVALGLGFDCKKHIHMAPSQE
jgi:hypothetical protein